MGKEPPLGESIGEHLKPSGSRQSGRFVVQTDFSIDSTIDIKIVCRSSAALPAKNRRNF
ncbi:hypothetical protein LJB99_06790 [Deltaproteobacteria bacterium OttesenSCG-928-K17]|nr:hypothetical protein [Deltaproteobacteria bacterium OttesenSCG-928-K17]